MVYKLPYETRKYHYRGHHIGPGDVISVGDKTIENIIIDATRNWAFSTHIQKKIPFPFQETQQLPKEFTPFRYNGDDYLPWDIYIFMELGKTAIPQFQEASFRDEINVATYFIKEVHKAIREDIFAEFIPNYRGNESEHPDPKRMSFRHCLEYAKEKASAIKLEGSYSPRETIEKMLIEKKLKFRTLTPKYDPYGIYRIISMINKALDRLYFS